MYGQVVFCFLLLYCHFLVLRRSRRLNSDVSRSVKQKQKAESEKQKQQRAAKMRDNTFLPSNQFLQDFIFFTPLYCHSEEEGNTKTTFTAYKIKIHYFNLFFLVIN